MIFRAAVFAVVLFFGQAVAYVVMPQGGHDTPGPSHEHEDHKPFPFNPIPIPTLLKRCCFRIGYGALMKPTNLAIVACTPEFLHDAPSKMPGGAMGVAHGICPADAQQAARLIDQKLPPSGPDAKSFCFRIGYGDGMKPCCLAIVACTPGFLPGKIPGGARGVSAIRPADAEEAARLIDQEISRSPSGTPSGPPTPHEHEDHKPSKILPRGVTIPLLDF